MSICLDELLERTEASRLYKGLNAFGDAAGQRCLGLDRDESNRIVLSEDNQTRCVHYLKDHPKASYGMVTLWPEFAEGDELLKLFGSSE